MHAIVRQLQQNLKFRKWATANGFKFSKSKTVCLRFCYLRKAHNDQVLTLDGTKIPVGEQNKFEVFSLTENYRLFLTSKS